MLQPDRFMPARIPGSGVMEPIERFRDRGVRIEAIRRQKIVGGDRRVACALVEAGELVAFPAGAEIITQGAYDRDAYFLLAGKVDLRINGVELPYGRAAGEVVGEFSAINSAIRRSATVVATEDVVAVKCDPAALDAAATMTDAELWRLLAVELTYKVEQRNRFIASANERPSVFMIAAQDHISVAEEFRLALSLDFDVQLWSDEDLAPPGSYELERLRQFAAASDFALVLAHPDDLRRSRDRQAAAPSQTILFELGYLMSVLGRYRTLLLIPEDERADLPDQFKGLKPWCYPPPVDGVAIKPQLAQTVRRLRNYLVERKTRSRLVVED